MLIFLPQTYLWLRKTGGYQISTTSLFCVYPYWRMVVNYWCPSCVKCHSLWGCNQLLVWLLLRTWIWLFLWLVIMSTGWGCIMRMYSWLRIGPNKLVQVWCQCPLGSSVIVSGSGCFVFTVAWHGRHSSRVFNVVVDVRKPELTAEVLFPLDKPLVAFVLLEQLCLVY